MRIALLLLTLAIASYNAGPAKVSRLLSEARKVGHDSKVWFQNFEIITAKWIEVERA